MRAREGFLSLPEFQAGLRGEGPDAADLEQELNERVYRLFGLIREEIALIKESLGRSAAR